jgi:hypothetical protein
MLNILALPGRIANNSYLLSMFKIMGERLNFIRGLWEAVFI